MDETLDTGASETKKKPNYLLYGGILIVLVGGLYLLLKMKGSSSSTTATSGTAAGTDVGGTTVGSSPPVEDTTTEYIYNIKDVGNSKTTNNTTTDSNNSTTAPTSSASAGGSSSGSVPVSTGSANPEPVSTTPVYSPPPTDTSGSHAVSAVAGYTDTGVARLNQNASDSAKLAQLASRQATSIPGLSKSTVAYDKSLARSGQIVGTTDTNVVQLNRHDSVSSAASILKSDQPVSISGVSSADVAYLQNLARQGKLTAATYQKVTGT